MDDKLVVDIDVKARRVSDADVAVPSIAIMPICSAQEEDSRQSVSLSNSPTNRTGDFRFRSSSEFLTLSPSAEREREILIESDENRRSVSQSSGAETEAAEIRQHEIKTIPSSYNRVSLSTLLSMTGLRSSLSLSLSLSLSINPFIYLFISSKANVNQIRN